MSMCERTEPIAQTRPDAVDLTLQQQLADAVQAFAARVRERGEIPPFPPDRAVTATDGAIVASAIMKACEIYSFELAAMFNV